MTSPEQSTAAASRAEVAAKDSNLIARGAAAKLAIQNLIAQVARRGIGFPKEEGVALEGSDSTANGADSPGSGAPPAWRDELSERVQDYRRRRGRARRAPEPGESLEFDFGSTETPGHQAVLPGTSAEIIGNGGVAEVLLAKPARSQAEPPVVDSVHLSSPTNDAAASEALEIPLDSSSPGQEVVEILLESAHLEAPDVALETAPLPVTAAPLGRRFLAGILDALVLILGAGLFGLIFWRAGGQLLLTPVSMAVLALIGVIFVMAYFGLFTAIAASTPGMVWLGLEVRNLGGGLPTWRESFWRAFGYLVSFAALALGFVWALVDSRRLTWHDHMSGTLVTSVESPTAGVNLLPG